MNASRRRVAMVLAELGARAATPPGIDPDAFAQACLADSYELLADLAEVRSGIVGDSPAIEALLWPDAVHLPSFGSLRTLAEALSAEADELVIIPAAVPDLPGLVIAKVFKALNRSDACIAPERGAEDGWVAFGLRLPWPDWLPDELDLAADLHDQLKVRAPRRTSLAIGPDWHRMRTPASVHRLDPGLEGWDLTRALLSGHALGE